MTITAALAALVDELAAGDVPDPLTAGVHPGRHLA